MPIRPRELKDVSGNGSNGIVQLVIPAGLKLSTLYSRLDSGTLTIAQITNVKLLANSEIIFDLSGTELDEMNKAEGLTAYDGTTLSIPMTLRNNMKESQDTMSTALNVGPANEAGTSAIANAKLQLTIVGATSPVLSFWADAQPATPEGPGLLKRLRTFNYSLPAGEGSILTLPSRTAQTNWFSRLAFKADSGTTGRLRVQGTDGAGVRDLWDRISDVNDRALTDGGGTPGSYFTYLASWREQGLLNILNTVGFSEIDIRPTSSAANSSAVVVEYIGTL